VNISLIRLWGQLLLSAGESLVDSWPTDSHCNGLKWLEPFPGKNPNAPPADKAQKLCAGVITRNQLANLTAYIINTKKEAPKTKQLLTIFG